MKHLIATILLLSCVIIAKAEWVKGTIIYTNGVTKDGFIKIFTEDNALSIKFKQEPGSEVVSIESESIRELKMQLQSGDLLVTRFLKTTRILSEELKTSKTKSWYTVVFRGDFDILTSYNNFVSANDFFISWPEDDFATMILLNSKNSLAAIGQKSLLKKSVSVIFKDRCDAIVEAVKSERFLPEEPEDIIYYYKDNCTVKKVISQAEI